MLLYQGATIHWVDVLKYIALDFGHWSLRSSSSIRSLIFRPIYPYFVRVTPIVGLPSADNHDNSLWIDQLYKKNITVFFVFVHHNHGHLEQYLTWLIHPNKEIRIFNNKLMILHLGISHLHLHWDGNCNSHLNVVVVVLLRSSNVNKEIAVVLIKGGRGP